ncbi:hypothetical protein ACI65C_007706 [Semiaphis heraclei]
MEDLYISSSAAAESCTNNNVEEDSPKNKKWTGGLAILQETAAEGFGRGEDSGGSGGGGKPPMSPPERRNRRKSWQMGRLDKKRRKSVSVLSPIPDAEQLDCTRESAYYKSKRSSWWNIFAHDNWSRSRRNSDFGASTDERIPYKRGKSRSVDHGLSSPFDLDSLRRGSSTFLKPICFNSEDGNVRLATSYSYLSKYLLMSQHSVKV